jgi:hypothetical protein
MKRLLALVPLILFCALSSKAQTQTTTIRIVAPASLCSVIPTPGSFYQNTAAPISLASVSTPSTTPPCTTTGFNSSCTATVGTTAITPISPATQLYNSTTGLLSGTIPASALSATPGTLVTITISCTASPLTFNAPVVLPNGTVGISYTASLLTVTGLTGGTPPYTWTLNSGSLPVGLTLSSNGIVAGVPSSSGSSIFSIKVTDSSGVAINFDSPVLPFRDRATRGGMRG